MPRPCDGTECEATALLERWIAALLINESCICSDDEFCEHADEAVEAEQSARAFVQARHTQQEAES